jgi:putative ABC transport system permease protein
MRPAWRLGINSLSGRRSRSMLLVASVALSSALIATVACAMASMHSGLKQRIDATVGAADLRVARTGKDALTADVAEKVRAWPETKLVVARAQGPIILKNPANGNEAATVGNGVDAAADAQVRAVEVVEGRRATALGEIAIDQAGMKELGAKVGDTLSVSRWGDAISLKVVGVVRQPGIGMGVMTRAESQVTLEQMGVILEKPGTIKELDVVLKDSRDSERVAQQHKSDLGPGVLVRTSAKITSGLDQSQRTGRIGLTVASAIAMLSAAFIIMTGLTTNVTERIRELAMLRCIGGTKGQMAESQIVMGLTVGAMGAVVGIPAGTLGAWVLVNYFRDHFPAGFTFNTVGVLLGVAAAVLAGLLGSLLPAWKAARTSPLDALAARSKPARGSGLVLCGVAGLALVALHIVMFTVIRDPDHLLFLDLGIGLPGLFAGYFLLSVPVVWIITTVLGPLLSKVLAIPAGLLVRSVQATPYRFGFTSGAMMLGLALMVSIWTNGRSIDRDVLSSFKFPDAFAAGLNISERTQKRIAALPFVKKTTPITVQNFRTDAFGFKALDNASTTFIAFEPDDFLNMANIKWLEGDKVSGVEALRKGGAVLVAKEFRVARGVGVGDTLKLSLDGKKFEFKVVGVVASPGLDVVSKYFEIGDDFLDVAVNAVFGSREDLKRLVGVSTVRLMQIDLKSDGEFAKLSDADAIRQIRKAGGFEVLDAGSGREIIKEIRTYVAASLYVFSLVAVGGMLVACFGVANLIVAGIQARQFEFGVLRAIGAQKGLIARMVLGEALIIALAACIVGTCFGFHGAWAGQKMNELTLGFQMTTHLPVDATALGWVMLTVITVGAALPAILSVNRAKPRELLGAVRG